MMPSAAAPPKSRSVVAAVVLLAGLVLSTTAAVFAYRAFDADESQRFSEAVDEIHGDLQRRLDFFANSVKQLAGVYALNPQLKQDAFLDFTLSSGIRANDAGIFSYGVFRRQHNGAKNRWFLDLRQIGPAGPTFVSPLGQEVSDNKERVDLFNAAIDAAHPVIATHVPALYPNQQSGQMMGSAVFEKNQIPKTIEKRRKKAIGVAYARFSDAGLFDQVFQNAGAYKSHLQMQVFDGVISPTSKPLYEKQSSSEARSFPRAATFQVKVGDRSFSVKVLSNHSPLWSTATLSSILILALGVAASLLGFRIIRLRDRKSERLAQSERQLRLVTDSLPVMIAYVDQDFTYRFINRIYETLHKRPSNEILNRRVEDIVGPELTKQIMPNFKRAMAGERVEQDWPVKLADGTSHHFHQTLLPDVNEKGEVKGIIVMHSDVTERAKSQANAEFLEEVSSILATSLEPTVVAQMLTKKLLAVCDWCVIELLDDEGKIDRHEWASSTPERHARLKEFYEVYPPETTQRRLTNRARETKQTQYVAIYSNETMLPWIPDDNRRRLLMNIGFESVVIVPLMSQDRVLGTIAMYSGEKAHRYTTEDVHYFEEIALRSSLAFENARLYAQSQNLNRAKDNFLAMLSHELRTPMNVILGWLEILTTEDVDKETYDQALETLNRNAKVQIQLINDLLDVSRIINGKLSLHASPGNLGAITSSAVNSVQPAVRAKNIVTSLKSDGDLVAAIDAERIQQVLWNLMSNAVKFTPNDGKIDVTVTGDTKSVRITVTDNGQGIEPSFLPFVFDRFRQEEGGFTRSQGGLGLGLSIVRYIVEGHGGTIGVESKGRGQGSTFWVVLPKTAQISDEIHFTPSVP